MLALHLADAQGQELLRHGAGGECYPRESLPVVEAKTPPERRYGNLVEMGNGTFGARIEDCGQYRRPRGLRHGEPRDPGCQRGARLLRGHNSADVNDVPAAVPLDALEAVTSDLAGLTATRPTPDRPVLVV